MKRPWLPFWREWSADPRILLCHRPARALWSVLYCHADANGEVRPVGGCTLAETLAPYHREIGETDEATLTRVREDLTELALREAIVLEGDLVRFPKFGERQVGAVPGTFEDADGDDLPTDPEARKREQARRRQERRRNPGGVTTRVTGSVTDTVTERDRERDSVTPPPPGPPTSQNGEERRGEQKFQTLTPPARDASGRAGASSTACSPAVLRDRERDTERDRERDEGSVTPSSPASAEDSLTLNPELAIAAVSKGSGGWMQTGGGLGAVRQFGAMALRSGCDRAELERYGSWLRRNPAHLGKRVLESSAKPTVFDLAGRHLGADGYDWQWFVRSLAAFRAAPNATGTVPAVGGLSPGPQRAAPPSRGPAPVSAGHLPAAAQQALAQGRQPSLSELANRAAPASSTDAAEGTP